MKSYSSREIIKMLVQDGWYLERICGDHYIFKNNIKKAIVSVPHPRKDMPVGTLKSIQKQTGITFK